MSKKIIVQNLGTILYLVHEWEQKHGRLTGALEDGTELSPSVFGTEAGVSASLLCSGAVPSAFVSGFMPTASSSTAFCK